jgi:1-deoxy-D-xylulose-5-phosphate reductoisomerase
LKKRVAILGSTGSIGTQALEVISAQAEHFAVELLTSNSNADLLIEQAKKFVPKAVVIADETKSEPVRTALKDFPIKVSAGKNAVADAVASSDAEIVLAALVGFSGLMPTLAAVKSKKNIALANKETLVVAGEIISSLVKENQVSIYPVDSEHSAIFQCLQGEDRISVEKIYLTASGGPFRGKKANELGKITPSMALKHPNWKMGNKITIDSATLMNKGLEVIEAKWLFHLSPEQIEVILHPQSIIHSIVQFKDGSMKAQMGYPDMKLPIQYALGYPDRIESSYKRFRFGDASMLTFEKPDTETFRCLDLAYAALKTGGTMPCIMNAANEEAVNAFLKEKISFLQIAEVIETCMNKIPAKQTPSLDDLTECDRVAREYALFTISSQKNILSIA